jgi:hypothetical protein
MLLGIGTVDLGLSAREFWAMTPAQFYALCDRKQLQNERDAHGPALITSAIYNVNRPKNHRLFTPKDFMPHYGEEEEPALPPDELHARFQSMMGKKLRGKG